MQQPLAESLRPKSLEEVVGQKHLLGKNAPLFNLINNGKIVSMILYGPPGCGKTTLARLIANYVNAKFVSLSAVTSGKKDVLKVVEMAKEYEQALGKKTILFIDEIHRFSKLQQDAFLPYVEDGTIILIGATTENPSFSINSPLLSRTRIFRLNSLEDEDIKELVNRAISKYPKHKFKKDAIEFIVSRSGGDARVALNTIEMVTSLTKNVGIKDVEKAMQKRMVYYDKDGDNHYDAISAFIKSMRGGDADATLHYLARMIKAGEDPVFIARRMVIFASEDVGNVRPNALLLATTCMQAVSMIGMPESGLILAQTATYLATCPKSLSVTKGLFSALDDIDLDKLDPIPLHLRNAENKYMKVWGYGKDHIRYPWLVERETGKKVNQEYMPENLKNRKYYIPDWKSRQI